MRQGAHVSGLVAIALLALAVGACAEASGGYVPDQASRQTSQAAASNAVRADCDLPEGQPLVDGDSAELVELGEVGGATISAAIYPHPEYEGNPWSQWGQGIVVEDGRFFSAIGDHLGIDGNSYVYEFDPSSRELTMVGDVLGFVDHVPGTWGYGKIHSQMVPGPCGEIYFSTYWGTFRQIEFQGNYTGDLLFRLDPYGRTMAPLQVPVEFHGQASLGAAPERGLVYGEAVDPVLKNDEVDRGPFFVYDVVNEEVVFTGPDEPHVGYRSILVDAEGTAYYSIGESKLASYVPDTGELVTAEFTLPGNWLRAVTNPSPDGSVYGATVDPDAFFALRPDRTIEDLGAAVEYTTSLGLSPDGSQIYYMPGAHGYSAEWGSPLISVDTVTGEQRTIAELNEIVETELGYTVGGTYDIAVSPSGETIYMGVNANVVGGDGTFGEVLLLVIDLP